MGNLIHLRHTIIFSNFIHLEPSATISPSWLHPFVCSCTHVTTSPISHPIFPTIATSPLILYHHLVLQPLHPLNTIVSRPCTLIPSLHKFSSVPPFTAKPVPYLPSPIYALFAISLLNPCTFTSSRLRFYSITSNRANQHLVANLINKYWILTLTPDHLYPSRPLSGDVPHKTKLPVWFRK